MTLAIEFELQLPNTQFQMQVGADVGSGPGTPALRMENGGVVADKFGFPHKPVFALLLAVDSFSFRHTLPIDRHLTDPGDGPVPWFCKT